jgi:shikimate kinase
VRRPQQHLQRILLVGFMGSGKNQVGRAPASRLGWSIRDFDDEICARTGLSIPEIFREHGGAFYRGVEDRVGADLLRGEGVVLALGGGWPVAQGRMEGLGPDTLSIWLQVTPEAAVRGSQRKEGPTRPLLVGADPVGNAAILWEVREPYYRKAHVAIDSTGIETEELAKRIEEMVRDKVRSGSVAFLCSMDGSGKGYDG